MATDYIVVDGESVVMVGEPFVLRELVKMCQSSVSWFVLKRMG